MWARGGRGTGECDRSSAQCESRVYAGRTGGVCERGERGERKIAMRQCNEDHVTTEGLNDELYEEEA